MKTKLRCHVTRLTASAFAVVSSFLLVPCSFSQIPQLINYQGRVAVTGVNFNGTGNFKFALVNGSGTQTYWSNDGTSVAGSQPTVGVTRTVTNGLYSVLLGDTSLGAAMTTIPLAVFNNSDVRLRVWFNDGPNGYQLLTPDQRIAAVGYAVMAANVPDGAITTAKIAAGAVTSVQLANGAIGAAQLGAGAAAANLNAGGQSAVGSGGAIVSTNPNATELIAAGYVRLTAIESAERYRSLRNTPPSARCQHSATWTGAEMIIFGGINNRNGAIYGDGARYDPALDRWTALPQADSPGARFAHTSVWSADRMIIWGGANTGATLGDGGSFDPALNVWIPIPVSPVISARSYHSAVVLGTTMVVWGGTSIPTGGGPLNTGGRLDVLTLQWTATSTGANSATARYVHRAIATDTEMIVWGGAASGGTYLNTGARYNPATDTWQAMATPALATRYAHVLVWTGARMIAWGGVGNLTYSDGAMYNPANNTWTAMAAATGVAGRYYFSGIWTGSELIVFGGKDPSGLQLGDGGRFNPNTNQWTTLPAPDLLARRWLHTAIWTGGEMIVWGGDFSDGLDTGRRYSPTGNAWLTMQTPRRDEIAVWTGTELIFWGGQISLGYNSADVIDDGLRWNAATNSWRRIPPDPAMPVRYGHTAVWSGSEMIVWGGSQAGGGRYNPAGEGTWTAIPSRPELDYRYGHSAVWTGAEMIIWSGGTYETFIPNIRMDGGRYNPVTGNWTLFPGNVAVPGRLGHSTVWTGGKMIVWGGYSVDAGNVYTYLNSGGIFNPVPDQWTAINTAGAPAGRYGHTAVWTGVEMIAWGGSSATYPYIFADGGRYNLSGDAWTMIAVPAATLSGRSGHMAVWTGTEMLIWGGDGYGPGGIYRNWQSGGARFDPTGTGTWSPIAPNREIGGRSRATAIWTGTEMIVTNSSNSDYQAGNYAEVFSYTPPRTLYLYLRP